MLPRLHSSTVAVVIPNIVDSLDEIPDRKDVSRRFRYNSLLTKQFEKQSTKAPGCFAVSELVQPAVQ